MRGVEAIRCPNLSVAIVRPEFEVPEATLRKAGIDRHRDAEERSGDLRGLPRTQEGRGDKEHRGFKSAGFPSLFEAHADLLSARRSETERLSGIRGATRDQSLFVRDASSMAK
jgi:hypothetical protein